MILMAIGGKGLQFIECSPALRCHLFEPRGGESCLFLELCAQIGRRGIAHLGCNVSERKFIVDEEFFNAFDAVRNEEFLQRLPFDSGKEIGEIVIVKMETFLQKIGQP